MDHRRTASSTSPQHAYWNSTLNPNPTSAMTPNSASAAETQGGQSANWDVAAYAICASV